MKNLLEIRNLTVKASQQSILSDVSFNVPEGKITAIVGASGSGKTTITNSILGLMPEALSITEGTILFEGKDLLKFSAESLRQVRGKDIAMIFQEPLWAFNPLMRIGQQIDEVLVTHTSMTKQQRKDQIIKILFKVQLSHVHDMFERYPHQLSGGQRQRAMIAQALVTGPKLVIADEPTSNLDVTIQAHIIELFRQLKKEGLTMLLISHDLGLVSHLADQVIMLKEGVIVPPDHPYTKSFREAFV